MAFVIAADMVFLIRLTEIVPPMAVPVAVPPPVATPTEPVALVMTASLRALTVNAPVCLRLLTVSTLALTVLEILPNEAPTP